MPLGAWQIHDPNLPTDTPDELEKLKEAYVGNASIQTQSSRGPGVSTFADALPRQVFQSQSNPSDYRSTIKDTARGGNLGDLQEAVKIEEQRLQEIRGHEGFTDQFKSTVLRLPAANRDILRHCFLTGQPKIWVNCPAHLLSNEDIPTTPAELEQAHAEGRHLEFAASQDAFGRGFSAEDNQTAGRTTIRDSAEANLTRLTHSPLDSQLWRHYLMTSASAAWVDCFAA